MASIYDNLNTLERVKSDIKTVLENRGVSLDNVPFTDYSVHIENMPVGEDLDAELTEQDAALDALDAQIDELPDKPEDMLQRKVNWSKDGVNLFYQCPDEDMRWVNNLDTSEITRMSNMFEDCKNATVIDISSYNIENVKSMNNMFKGCTKLKNIIGLSELKGYKVETIQYLLENCYELESIDLSNLKPDNLVNMGRAFRECEKAKVINIEGIDTSNVANFSFLFDYCFELATVLGEIDLLNATNVNSILNNCRAIKDIMFKNIKISLQIGQGSNSSAPGRLLTNKSLINTVQELWDNTNDVLGGSRTLTLHKTSKENISNIYVKLVDITEEMIANDPYIVNKKPCVVCDASDEGAMTLTEYAISKNWAIA